ncbi:MAG TPA: response regulator [Gemmata sp.]
MSTTRILIVEDEALIAEELRDRLEQLGHTVIDIVDTAESAIATAAREAPGLVLMDIRLRGDEDGIDAATLISERADVPIVFMTAHSDADTIARAMLIRPYGYVVKPVREADLVTAVQTALLRHAAEERLRACEKQSSAIVESATDLIFQILPDGRLLAGNPAGRRALGYSPSQLCRTSLSDVITEGQRNELPPVLQRAAEGEHDVAFRFTLVTAHGHPLPVEGVIGRRQIGSRLDRLWAVLHPVGA